MSELIKICGIALLCVFASAVLGQIGSGFTHGIKVAGYIIIFGAVTYLFGARLTETWKLFEGRLGDGGLRYAEIMFKAVGVGYVSTLCGSICRDLGENSAAGGIETAGKLAIASLALPLIGEILEYVSGLLAAV